MPVEFEGYQYVRFYSGGMPSGIDFLVCDNCGAVVGNRIQHDKTCLQKAKVDPSDIDFENFMMRMENYAEFMYPSKEYMSDEVRHLLDFIRSDLTNLGVLERKS